jgi:hypothetical protein
MREQRETHRVDRHPLLVEPWDDGRASCRQSLRTARCQFEKCAPDGLGSGCGDASLQKMLSSALKAQKPAQVARCRKYARGSDNDDPAYDAQHVHDRLHGPGRQQIEDQLLKLFLSLLTGEYRADVILTDDMVGGMLKLLFGEPCEVTSGPDTATSEGASVAQ